MNISNIVSNKIMHTHTSHFYINYQSINSNNGNVSSVALHHEQKASPREGKNNISGHHRCLQQFMRDMPSPQTTILRLLICMLDATDLPYFSI